MKDGTHTHGGKRTRHVPPKLDMQAVALLRQMRDAGTPYREICQKFGVSRNVAGQAYRGQGAYPKKTSNHEKNH